MTPAIDPRLVEQVRRGDHGALGRLLEQSRDQLFNVCLRMVGHRDDAAELTQEAMLKIIEHIDDYNGSSAITTWMVRIAMNLSISHLRRQKLRRAASLDAPLSSNTSRDGHAGDQAWSLLSQMEDLREPDPATSVEEREEMAHLIEAMDRLDEEFRSVLVLRDLQDMDYQEIAEILAVPVGTVKSRLFRARLALRQEMLRLCPPPHRRPETPPPPTVARSNRPATPQGLSDG